MLSAARAAFAYSQDTLMASCCLQACWRRPVDGLQACCLLLACRPVDGLLACRPVACRPAVACRP